MPDAQVLGDLDATLAWAAKAGGNTQKAAITGFCWGGRITWLYAASGKVEVGDMAVSAARNRSGSEG